MKTIPNNIFFEEVVELLKSEEKVKITVQGTSMRPFFKSGADQVNLIPVSDNTKKNRHTSLKRGDIILFHFKNQTILHRIYHIHGTLIIARGDNCYGRCEKITTADVIAKVESGTCFGRRFNFSSKGIFWCTSSFCWRHTYKIRRYLLHLRRVILFKKK